MNRSRRRLLSALAVATSVLLVGLVWAGYTGYNYSESTEFCTTRCHAAMLPQASAHSRSSHNGVGCVQCHAAGGTGSKLQAKLAGTSRAMRAFLDNYERPIRTDCEHSAPANTQCRRCHTMDALPPNKSLTIKYFRADEQNSPEQIALTLRLGAETASDSAAGGAHKHALERMRVAYVATDSLLQDIPWVTIRRRDGSEATYVSDSTKLGAAELSQLPRHEMDCTSCHNRAGHSIANPNDSLDRALLNGELDGTLPWIKQLGAAAIADSLLSNQASLRHALFSAYQVHAPGVLLERPADVEQASVVLGRILGELSFAATSTKWDTYPDNLGHRNWPGCFRCHDGRHTTADGKVLSNDCEHTCHSLPLRGSQTQRPTQTTDSDWHPVPSPAKTLDIAEHRQLTCPSCHRAGGTPKRTCDDCHST